MRQALGQQFTWLDQISVLRALKARPTRRCEVQLGLGAVLQSSNTPIPRVTEVEHEPERQTPNTKREAPHRSWDHFFILHASKTGLAGVLSLFVAQALRLQ